MYSITCGRSVNSGHYSTCLVRNDSVINVSDTIVGIGTEVDISKNSYVIFYDKHVTLNPVVKSILEMFR